MKVVAINGSPRQGGNTAVMIGWILKELEGEGLETELVQLGGRTIRGCQACFQCFENKDGRCAFEEDAANEIIAKMAAAQGVILASPTYFGDVTAEMKALIDRAGFVNKANGQIFRRKVGASLAVARRHGNVHVLATLNNFLLANQFIVPGTDHFNTGFGRNKGEVLEDREARETMGLLGRNMAWLLDKING